jgi:ADP-ribose pyrophosphatase YjhB (NUDIX family)
MGMCKAKKTVDIVAKHKRKIVLIRRLTFPMGLALPGGKVEENERPIKTAVREFKEETGLTLSHVRFLFRVSGKKRDPRWESASRVYAAKAEGNITNEPGKTEVVLLSKREILLLPDDQFAFDHGRLLKKVLCRKK